MKINKYKFDRILAFLIVALFILLMILVSFGIFSAFVYAICSLMGYEFRFELGVALYLVVAIINLFIMCPFKSRLDI